MIEKITPSNSTFGPENATATLRQDDYTPVNDRSSNNQAFN